jgi:hypothetical protein
VLEFLIYADLELPRDPGPAHFTFKTSVNGSHRLFSLHMQVNLYQSFHTASESLTLTTLSSLVDIPVFLLATFRAEHPGDIRDTRIDSRRFIDDVLRESPITKDVPHSHHS